MRDIWVFGYGSLMWRPGFVFVERQVATLPGFARRFCLASMHYRGTTEAPGLVLALSKEAGSACEGIAFRIAAPQAKTALAYLRARELVSYAYREERHAIRLSDGRVAEALTYVSDPAHPQFRGELGLQEKARIIGKARGPAGSNRDYFFATFAQLEALGIVDEELTALAGRLGTREETGRA
ncbi:MAG: gamma-glutamylcyclotransferase [Pseudomonadota bacterium]